ncbi:MAG TPA: hypothetical protein VJN62_15680 [Gemmatimonadales bacterium]|nr:hypothetical protein [Gemmatimonadales bacterium]
MTTGTLPDPAGFDDPLDQSLAVLKRLTLPPPGDWLSSGDLSRDLRDVHGLSVHWRTIDALFGANLTLVTRRKRGQKWEYKILAAGESRVRAGRDQVIVLDPERAVEGVQSVHAILSGLKGAIRICDPYVDPTTIEHVTAIDKAVPIKLLTVTVNDAARFKRLLSAARTEGRSIEVRVAANGKLHDRYLIDDTRMVLSGTSINGLGKKRSFMVDLGADIRGEILAVFDRLWSSATAV